MIFTMSGPLKRGVPRPSYGFHTLPWRKGWGTITFEIKSLRSIWKRVFGVNREQEHREHRWRKVRSGIVYCPAACYETEERSEKRS